MNRKKKIVKKLFHTFVWIEKKNDVYVLWIEKKNKNLYKIIENKPLHKFL